MAVEFGNNPVSANPGIWIGVSEALLYRVCSTAPESVLVSLIPMVVELGKNPALGDPEENNGVCDSPEIKVVPLSPVLGNNPVLGDPREGNGVCEVSDVIAPVSDHIPVPGQEFLLSPRFGKDEDSSQTSHASVKDQILDWNSLSDREFGIEAQETIVASGMPNVMVRSNLNIQFFRYNLIDYQDYRIVDLLDLAS